MDTPSSPALELSHFFKERENVPMTDSLKAEIDYFVEDSMKNCSDTRIKGVLKNFGWQEGSGFGLELDVEGLAVAVRRTQTNSSFLRTSILHQDSTTCFVPEILKDHLSAQRNNKEFFVRPFSQFMFGAVLLVDISGFTKLSGYYCAQGPDGIDELRKVINGYLGDLASVIYSFSGDIIKYAGDAVLCWFSDTSGAALSSEFPGTPSSSKLQCCKLAVTCAMQLKEMYTPDLSVHVAVTTGDVCFGILGGYDDRFDCLISGPCLQDLSQCLDDAKAREVVVSAELHSLYSFFDEKDRFEWRRLDSGNYQLLDKHDGTVETISEDICPFSPLRNSPHSTGTHVAGMIAQFVPEPVCQQLCTGDLSELGELREVTTMFIQFQSYDYEKHRDLLSLQDAFYGIQQAISEQGGFIRQFLVDDKGCVCVALWGVPSATHIDNAYRAVSAASALNATFEQCGEVCSIGITTGKVFTGTVGSMLRKEYAAIGDSVNMAARLMCKANGDVYLDFFTASKLSKTLHDRLKSMGKFAVKGKAEPMEVFSFIIASAHNPKTSLGGANKTNFSHIRPQVLHALRTALDGIVTLQEEVGASHKSRTVRRAEPTSGKTAANRNVSTRNISAKKVGSAKIGTNSVGGMRRGGSNVLSRGPRQMGTGGGSDVSFNFLNNFSMHHTVQPEESVLSGLGHLVLLEGKTEFEKLNIISWLTKDCSDNNLSVKEIEMTETDRHLPLELWRKLYREIIGSDICDDIDQLECYFFPLLKDLEPNDPLFVDEIAIPILCTIFRIHNSSLNFSYDNDNNNNNNNNNNTLQYRGLKLGHLPNHIICNLVCETFLRIMQNQVRTVFIIHNLHFVHELSLKIMLQSQGFPIFHIFFATSSLSSMSLFNMVADDSSSVSSKDSHLSGFGSRAPVVQAEDGSGDVNAKGDEMELPHWVRHLVSRIANVDIITLGPYTVDDIRLMLTKIAPPPADASAGAAPLPANAATGTANAVARGKMASHRSELAKLIHELSDGNAFWVEEFVSFIVEAGVESFMKTIRRGARETSLVRKSSARGPPRKDSTLRQESIRLPTTSSSTGTVTIDTANESKCAEAEAAGHASSLSALETFVVCRFERLSVAVQKVVRIAAVLGTRFSRHVLYGVLRRQQRNTMFSALQQLVDAKWITRLNTDMTTSTTDYKFNHPLLQSTLYKLLPATDRREVHRKAARCLVEVYGEREPRICASLIEHYAEFDHEQAFTQTIEFIAARIRDDDGFTMPTLRYLDLAITFATQAKEVRVLKGYIDKMCSMVNSGYRERRRSFMGAPSAVVLSTSRSVAAANAKGVPKSQSETRNHAVGAVGAGVGKRAPPQRGSFLARLFLCLGMEGVTAKNNKVKPQSLSLRDKAASRDDASDDNSFITGQYGEAVLHGVDSEEIVELIADIEYRFQLKAVVVARKPEQSEPEEAGDDSVRVVETNIPWQPA